MKTALQSELTRPIADAKGLRVQFQSLVSGCGIYDLSGRARIKLTGGDRVRWLNGMVSNNIRDLAKGHSVYAFLLNAQARIQGDMYAYNLGDSLLVDVEQGQRDKIWEIFDHYIIADDVEMADVTDQTAALELTGPQSRAVLLRAGITPPDLVALQFADIAWQQSAITLLKGAEEAGESWQIWMAPEEAKTIWDALAAAGATPVEEAALNLFRISRGVPQFGTDIRDRDLPQETGLTRALNFTKGCYLGQEIVERIRSRGAVHRHFTAFEVEGLLPGRGSKIVAGEKEVGEITSSASLPFPQGDRAIALGYLRREAIGQPLAVGESQLKVVSTPVMS